MSSINIQYNDFLNVITRGNYDKTLRNSFPNKQLVIVARMIYDKRCIHI